MKRVELGAMLVSLVAIGSIGAVAVGQVREEWVARYDGTASAEDVSCALAVGADGNVYVTGWSMGVGTGRDYVTVKYSASGQTLWVARYNGPGNGDDRAYAVGVDAGGNVYVTGYCDAPSHFKDYATIKYDSDGNQEWVEMYDGPAGRDDAAMLLAVDSEGNVCVSGYSYGAGPLHDYLTIKYDSTGRTLWARRYNGAGNLDDVPHGMVLDAANNITITGESDGWTTGFDYGTIRYDPDGRESWISRYNSPASSEDVARGIAEDAAGNVCVTGGAFTYIGDSAWDIATVKYDSTGNQLWEVFYNGSGNANDEGSDVATDAAGNVLVCGRAYGNGTRYDYVTIKYDPNGEKLWTAVFDGPANGYDVATCCGVDARGNTYVTGQSAGVESSADYATIKYDGDGHELWQIRYNGPRNGDDVPADMLVLPLGVVYVTGRSRNGSDHDFLTVKYTQYELVNASAAMLLKGKYNSGDVGSLAADDDNYYIVGAQYDPTDPAAVINASVRVDGNADAGSYSGGTFSETAKCTTEQAKYRIRLVKADGSFVTPVDNVPTEFTETTMNAVIPTPVSDFIDAANGNRVRSEIRAASGNRTAGFFLYKIDLAQWVLTP